MRHSSLAIVLKKEVWRESDFRFILYTKEFGKITAFAQGVRKQKAKLRGHLENFCLTKVEFVHSRQGLRLVGANVVNFWGNIFSDWQKIRTAAYIVELIDRLCLEGEKDSNIWRLLYKSLSILNKPGRFIQKDRERFLEKFRGVVLQLLGYGENNELLLEKSSQKKLAQEDRIDYLHSKLY